MNEQPSWRSLARRFPNRAPNPMFSELETQLHAALVDNTELDRELLREFYVCKRLSSYTTESRSAIVARMPKDIERLAIADLGNGSRIDVLELDLIDFLLHYTRNRLMSVVGRVGVGKTTFLRYVFENVRSECESLRRFIPIHLNLLKTGTDKPSFRDLVYVLVQETKKCSQSFAESGKVKLAMLTDLIESYERRRLSKGAGENGPSDFVEFVRQLQLTCAGVAEPVIILDNVDQLLPEAVRTVCNLAAGIHLNTKLCVITAMRPTTNRTQVERFATSRALSQFCIEVSAPDLREVIRARLRKALGSYASMRLVMNTGFSLELQVDQSLGSLSEKVLNPTSQTIFLSEICGDNVRYSLAAFEYFLRYRDLRFQLLFDARSDSQRGAEDLHGSWFGHLIDGLMIGDREFYVDDDGAPIASILVFRHKSAEDFAVLHWCLSLLSWIGGYTKCHQVVGCLLEIGYDEEIIMAALTHLLRRGLLFSPSKEYRVTPQSDVMLSAPGAYYVDRLLGYPQYVYNAVYDVPLPHAKWNDAAGDSFAVRMSSVVELIEATYNTEHEHVDRLVASANDRALELASAATHSRLLTQRLLACAHQLIHRTAKHSQFEGAKRAAEELGQKLAPLEYRLRKDELRISALLATQRWLPESGTERTTVARDVGPDNQVELTVPTKIGPALKNEVRVRVDLRGITDMDPVVAFWEGRTGGSRRYQEIAELKRTSDGGMYQGDFVIRDVDEVSEFPRSKITVFSASRPVLVTAI